MAIEMRRGFYSDCTHGENGFPERDCMVCGIALHKAKREASNSPELRRYHAEMIGLMEAELVWLTTEHR